MDKVGNLLLFGETLGSFLDNRGPTNGMDLFLLKISPAGQPLTVTQWGACKTKRQVGLPSTPAATRLLSEARLAVDTARHWCGRGRHANSIEPLIASELASGKPQAAVRVPMQRETTRAGCPGA